MIPYEFTYIVCDGSPTITKGWCEGVAGEQPEPRPYIENHTILKDILTVNPDGSWYHETQWIPNDYSI